MLPCFALFLVIAAIYYFSASKIDVHLFIDLQSSNIRWRVKSIITLNAFQRDLKKNERVKNGLKAFPIALLAVFIISIVVYWPGKGIPFDTLEEKTQYIEISQNLQFCVAVSPLSFSHCSPCLSHLTVGPCSLTCNFPTSQPFVLANPTWLLLASFTKKMLKICISPFCEKESFRWWLSNCQKNCFMNFLKLSTELFPSQTFFYKGSATNYNFSIFFVLFLQSNSNSSISYLAFGVFLKWDLLKFYKTINCIPILRLW